MKKYIVVLSLLSVTAITKAQSTFEKEPYLTKSLTKENIQQVNVQTSGGSIAVTGIDAGEARIEMYVTPNGNITGVSKEELKKRLEENYVVDVNVSGNTLTAKARNKNISPHRARLSLVRTIP